jgi:SM-20-related protein
MSGKPNVQWDRQPSIPPSALSCVCDAIAEDDVAVMPDFVPRSVIEGLALEARRRDAAGEFRPARVGRGERRVERSDVRGDRTLWLDEWAPATAEVALWSAFARLRVALNRATLLGLFDFEGHYALYPPGAFYRRHRDRFRDDDLRVLSCVLYLNADWSPGDGGALRVFLDAGETRDVLPIAGTLVCFRSERYEHEVLPARRERLAVTGWFLRRE